MDDRREAETPGTATTGGQLLSFLEQIGENLRRKRLLEWGSRIGFWSTALALVTLAIWYFAESFPVWVPALVLGFGLGGLAMLTAFSKRPPASEVARYLDARLAAHERYLTAEQCAREGNNNEVEDALLEQISVECGGMSAARLAPMEPPWETWGAVSILVAVLVFLLLWLAQWLIGMLAAPTVDEPVKQLVQEMKKVEQELKKPEAGKEANDVAKKLAQLMDDLAKGKKPDPETVRKALLDLPQVQKAMEQAGQKSPKLGRVAQFLSKSNFADRMDKALQSKDMKEVTDLSRELAQSIQDTGDDSPKAQQQQKSGQQQQSQQQSQQPPQQASAKGKPCESGPPGAKGQNGAGGQGGSVGPGASSGASSSAAGVPGAGAGKGKGSGGGGASPGANVTLGQGGGGGSPIESNSSSPSSDSDGGRGGQNQPGAQGSSQGQGSGNSAGQSGGAQGQQAGKDGKDGKDPGQSGGAQGQQAGKDSKEGKDPGQSGGAQGQQAGKDGQGANGQKAGEGGKQPDGKQGGEAGQSQPGKGMAGNGPGGSFASQAPMTPREKDLLDKLKQVAQGGKGKASGDVLKEMGKVLS
ncbi:MAG: hypothetical protein HY303_03470, partial [Candidatus Wallbacteria bacterium]|nr:hypothetical protein [Candidatus Wallbacteria bacterium]